MIYQLLMPAKKINLLPIAIGTNLQPPTSNLQPPTINYKLCLFKQTKLFWSTEQLYLIILFTEKILAS